MNISEIYKLFLQCGEVTTDSRNCPEGSMFIALKGESFNGNLFAGKALESGCRYAVVDEAEYVKGDNYILVEDTLTTLQQLANYHRRKLKTKIIGITGTNGKTTTKELVSAVLMQKYNVLFTQGNFNNHIGVPLTLLRLTKKHDLAVVEMGANHPGEISTLVNIAEPDYGIITNVGMAHLEGFGSLEGVIRTKGELYDYLRTKHNAVVFVQNENEHLNNIVHGLQTVRYGQQKGLAVSGELISCSPFLHFSWTADSSTYIVCTNLIGAYNLDNALAAVAVGLYMDVEPAQICRALKSYEPTNNRSQLKDTGVNKLIIDAYNANPTSMMAALRNFRLMGAERKMVILGDMKELGESSRDEHVKIVEYLKQCNFGRVILIGPEFKSVGSDYEVYDDASQVKEMLCGEKPKEYYILVKGSNSMKLSSLVEYL